MIWQWIQKLRGKVKVRQVDQIQYTGPAQSNLTPGKFYKVVGRFYPSEGQQKSGMQVAFYVRDEVGMAQKISHTGEVQYHEIWVSENSPEAQSASLEYNPKSFQYEERK